jgi:hypothetical protein
MLRKIALLVALAFAAITATVATPAFADCVSDATVTYVGADWGPIPMWRVAVPSLNTSWDVQADDAEAARARVAPLIACPAPAPVVADSPAPTVDPAPAPAPAGASDLAVGQATQIVLQADVTYVGNAWGPLPIWRVNVPSRNATYDVAATDADAARAAVLGTVAADIDRNPDVAPATVSAALAPSLAAADGTPVSVDTSVAAPVRVAPVRVVAPAKAKTAKRGIHAKPATSRTHR